LLSGNGEKADIASLIPDIVHISDENDVTDWPEPTLWPEPPRPLDYSDSADDPSSTVSGELQ